jgi:serine/threonine protein kinase/WD40 repeat protein
MGTGRAVKVVYRDTFDNDQPYEREFTGIRKFEPVSRSHESQVDILHIGRNDEQGYFYYVMELADDASRTRSQEGEVRNAERPPAEPPTTVPPAESTSQPGAYIPRTLQHDLDTRMRLPFAECLEISLGLAGALKHLHERGLVHRDIKPSNIIFVNGVPKLADIGLVTESEATVSYVGAQGFMPPEGPGRPQGDLYSLGKVIYEMCTGQDRMDFPALPPNFGQSADRQEILEMLAVSLKACEPNLGRRYASAAQMTADLFLLQAGKSLKRLRWLERNRRRALASAAILLVAAAGAWWVQREARIREELARQREAHSQMMTVRAGEREVRVRDAEVARLHDPQIGWSSKALHALRAASTVRRGNEDLRAQAVASLEGLDAQPIAQLSLTNPPPYDSFDLDPQARRVLIAGTRGIDGTNAPVQLWDLQTGAVTPLLSAGPGPVWFGPDGSPRHLATGTNGDWTVVNAREGKVLCQLVAPPTECGEASQIDLWVVSDDRSLLGATIACGSPSNLVNRLAVWNLSTGQLVGRADVQTNTQCTALAFSPDNGCLATGDAEGWVHLRSLPGWGEVATFHQARATIHSLAFQRDPGVADGPRDAYPWVIAAGDAGGTINIYHVAERLLKSICRGSHYNVLSLAFSPDGMTLVSAGRGDVRFWDVGTGRCLLTSKAGDFGTRLAFSDDGGKLVGLFQNLFGPAPALRVFSVEPHRGVMVLRGLSAQSGYVAFSHDSHRLAALSHNWEVGVWNLASNRLERLFEAPKGVTADNAALCFSPDDTQCAFATLTDARLWDLKSGRLLRSWQLPQGLCQQLCFDSAGRLLLFQWDSPWEREKRMCRTRDLFATNYLKPLAEFPEFRGRLFDVVLSGRGDYVSIIGQDSNGITQVRVHDPVTGRQLRALPDIGHAQCTMARDPETKRVAYWVPSANATMFFELPEGKSWSHPGRLDVNALAPREAWMAGGTSDGKGVNLFAAEDQAPRTTLGVDHVCTSLHSSFSPDGKLLAWGTAEGMVLVCDLEQTIRRLEGLGLGWR